jgi:hypothetical protein
MEWRPSRCVVELYMKDLFRSTSPARSPGLHHPGHHSHDPELGWVNVPNMDFSAKNVAGVEWRFTTDERGARGARATGAHCSSTTYGDSFTASVEVNDDQTWEVYLSPRARRRGAQLCG